MNGKSYKVELNNIQQSPQKLRLVADLVRGKKAEEAVTMLKFLNKKGAVPVLKGINSAIANAKDLDGTAVSELKVTEIFVNEGKVYKKYRFASRGRVSALHRRRSNLTVELSQY